MQRFSRCSWCPALLLVLASLTLTRAAENEPGLFNVRDQGARGDGIHLDRAAINRTIELCAAAGGGEVLVPPGRYLTGTIRLRSHITLYLSAGARLVGTTNLTEYENPTPPEYLPEASWGKWHRGLLVGENLEDVTIAGTGTIDGNKVFDPTGEEKMRGPHAIIFVNCREFTLRDITIVDAANYAVFFEVSDDVEVRNVKIVGGWDGVHWRGAPERWCRNVRIVGCQFYTGDDSIAGRYWDHALIADCIVNSSCNGLRLIGPARHLMVNNCLFYGPGLQPHRTSGAQRRTNMLSGIILQPGAWDATRGPLEDVLLSRITMKQVASPVTIWIKPGNTAGRITIEDLVATGVYRSALSVESWAQNPIEQLVLRNVHVEFTGGGKAEEARVQVRGPRVDARPLPAWAFYARNVGSVKLEDVRFSLEQPDERPVFWAEGVQHLLMDTVKFDRGAGGAADLVQTNVADLQLQETKLESSSAPMPSQLTP